MLETIQGINRLKGLKPNITGGTADGMPIGANTPSTGNFSSLAVNGTPVPARLGPALAGATKTLTAANAGQTIILDQASGSVVTLPAATGTGNVFRFIVGTTITSNSHKVLTAPTTDKLQGIALLQKTATVTGYQGTIVGAFHSLQMPATGTTPSGGNQGDWIELVDIAAAVWEVTMFGTAGGTVATPFSTATT